MSKIIWHSTSTKANHHKAIQRLREKLLAEQTLTTGLQRVISDLGDIYCHALTRALTDAYPSLPVSIVQQLAKRYLDEAERGAIVSLERLVEVE